MNTDANFQQNARKLNHTTTLKAHAPCENEFNCVM